LFGPEKNLATLMPVVRTSERHFLFFSSPCIQGDQMCSWENRPNRSPTHFSQNEHKTFSVVKNGSKIWAALIIRKTNAHRKQSPNGQKFTQSGHPACIRLTLMTGTRVARFFLLHDTKTRKKLYQISTKCTKW
jgi:hypothetical protein